MRLVTGQYVSWEALQHHMTYDDVLDLNETLAAESAARERYRKEHEAR